ncbi:MAG: cation-translocating P-type ATPase, partial [Kiritimatiellae bacterium]|nr:cation-translocating P-type ATPase [Kiritimatiellia bacterium]
VLIGLVALADTPRAEAKAALAELAEAGVAPCLLTGDHAATAAAVARELGVAEVKADLLPEQKAAAVGAIQDGGRLACMVGDGVNDAVALKTAHVGIAMGGAGSDIAVEAADIALVGDDLSKLAYLKRLSAGCVSIIKANIALSMCLNAVAITLSVLGMLTPVTGALVHNAGSVLVVTNAALLYDRKFNVRRRLL